MASSFMGLYVQRDGLNLAQKALDVTGNNITNSKTPGYSRQRIDLVSVMNNNNTLGYKNQVFLAGAGVDGKGVTQIRDDILDDKFRDYTSVYTDNNVKSSILSDIEDAIDDIEISDNESNKTGLAYTLERFKEAWQSFSSMGTDQTDLANIAQSSAQNVINVLRDFNNRIETISDNTMSDVTASVSRVNAILNECASLNKQIKAGYVSMDNYYETGYYDADGNDYVADTTYGPLEIKDKMNSLLDELATYCDISSQVETDGTYTIAIAGKDVVKADAYAKLTYRQDSALNAEGKLELDDIAPRELTFDISVLRTEKKWQSSKVQFENSAAFPGVDPDIVDQMYKALHEGKFNEAQNLERQYFLKPDGTPVSANYVPVFNSDEISSDISGGALKGQLDLFNGAGSYANPGENTYQGIEYYRKTFDALAQSIHDAFNSVYTKNGINGENGNGVADYDFKLFDFEPGKEGTVQGLIISKQWEENPLQAVHPAGTDDGDYNYDQISNEWINRITAVFEAKHHVGKELLDYTFEDYVAHYGNTIGNQIESIDRTNDAQEIMLNTVSDARAEVMGVSTDEEGINMLSYQKWYNAMGRMVTALDQLLDKLINSTGVVGL
ncbi:MAG: flagellar hook-associated protein FlgK [Oscillospiraceae bacterium]